VKNVSRWQAKTISRGKQLNISSWLETKEFPVDEKKRRQVDEQKLFSS
jgi:hypothetical protein